LAGASVAASLARRGWKVIVLDGASAPASGASGLPVGLVAPHDSADDCKLSRLTRAGVRLMLCEAARHLAEAQDWALSGSTEYHFDGRYSTPEHWSPDGAAWSQSVTPDGQNHRPLHDADAIAESEVPAIWHARSAWIKPAQLVRAWLSLPNITFQSNAQVTTLNRANGQWVLQNSKGQSLVSADRVVFANSNGAFPLMLKVQQDFPELTLDLGRLPAAHGVRGQLSFGRHADAAQATFPGAPINGAGSVIPRIPTPEGLSWFVGSSFQPDTGPVNVPEKNHWANFGRLQILSPELAAQLKPQFEGHHIQHWDNTRCVTADRLPIVGAVGDPHDSSLWLCAGMGSRGLSFSVLCAELMAAQWGAEPLPIEFNLAQSFSALRSANPTTA
jgi:tRNA 5-methylaminomethyl-2-thiouridine biosynthesis bifunctional protein